MVLLKNRGISPPTHTHIGIIIRDRFGCICKQIRDQIGGVKTSCKTKQLSHNDFSYQE